MTVVKHGLVPGFVLAAATSILTAQPNRFTLAMIRPDGALVPFAGYDDGRWERAWPEADESGSEDIDKIPSVWRRRGEPVPDIWWVWPESGGPPSQVRVTGVDVVEAHCSAQVALTTNQPKRDDVDHHKLRLAADAPNVAVSAVEEVRRADPLWSGAVRAVLETFSNLEKAQASMIQIPLPQETPGPAAQVANLYREIGSSRSAMYFVAEKHYPTARTAQDPQCKAVTIMTGWLLPTTTGSHRVVDPKVFLTDCDGKEVSKGLPVAALRISGRTYWIMQEHGYEDVSFRIAQVGESEVRYPIEVYGGGC